MNVTLELLVSSVNTGQNIKLNCHYFMNHNCCCWVGNINIINIMIVCNLFNPVVYQCIMAITEWIPKLKVSFTHDTHHLYQVNIMSRIPW